MWCVHRTCGSCVASPIKALQIAAADEERAEEEATKRQDEDDKKKRLKRQKELEKEMCRKATESAVQKVLSPKNLPLVASSPVDSCLRDAELIYRPDEDKQKEFEATLEKIHYERRHVDAAKEKTKEEEEEGNKRYGEEGEDAVPTGDNFGDLEDLLMPGKLYTSHKNTLPSENIESSMKTLWMGKPSEERSRQPPKRFAAEAKEQIILEAPDYTEANEWSDEEPIIHLAYIMCQLKQMFEAFILLGLLGCWMGLCTTPSPLTDFTSREALDAADTAGEGAVYTSGLELVEDGKSMTATPSSSSSCTHGTKVLCHLTSSQTKEWRACTTPLWQCPSPRLWPLPTLITHVRLDHTPLL